ncbi:MAG: hypothetical protein OER22_04960 [Gammaproteobacteria bacterium]|nr:hypothetical protein [Gammaproteobacteria bacterium]MDH3373125.1 hypothetical protein [Gammaproteobacteria bacterium]MDH3409642.1 hypothetical protein [Gammaproteobacteria bacterium]MDH3551945.1 hypothetical protein [Gammaproteobacteria bacterium]
MRSKTILALIVGAFALTACGDKLAGTYADDGGVTRYAFAGDGDVKILVLGTEVDAEYRLDGNKVLVSSAQGTVVLTRRDDRLYGPMGLELVRQSN